MDFYGFGIDFYQIWDVFNLYKPVLGAFFDVSTHFHVFYVWTRNGSKMRFQNLVFKGLNPNDQLFFFFCILVGPTSRRAHQWNSSDAPAGVKNWPLVL